MLNQEFYVREKLREFEREPAPYLARRSESTPRRAPVIGPAARGTGRLLRRLGESLESWAGREPETMRLGRNAR